MGKYHELAKEIVKYVGGKHFRVGTLYHTASFYVKGRVEGEG